MAYYALLGGKSIPHTKDFSLEEKILDYLKIRPKRILFIPLATYPDFLSSIYKFKELIQEKYTIDFLTEVEDKDRIKKLFEEAEVIYFAGGSAELLVQKVKEYKIDALIEKYQASNKLFIGISAGAILFSKFGMGDQYAYKDKLHIWNYKMVEGLGILPITICPHYDHDGLECYNEAVKEYPYNGYAIEDDTALLIFEKEVFIFKGDSKKSVYLFEQNQNFLMKPLYEK